MSIKPYFTYGVPASDRDLITSTTNYGGVHKRYFSSLDAEIFIGGERILDINRIDFSYEEKKLPYYGFNSFVPSKIFVGQKIVQGTFVINFTEAGYIAKLLQKIEKSDLSSEYDLIGQACSEENAPLFGKQFDILVGYGGYNVANEASLNNTHLVIQGAVINGYQQMLDTSGEPVMEMYSFIAKAIKFDGFKYPKKSDNPVITEDKNNNDLSTNRKWAYRVVEKRMTNEVTELKDRCNNDKKLLGIVVDVSHSLHKKDDKSHIYIDFVDQLNSNSNCRIADTPVTLTIADNEVNISRVIQSFKKTEGTDGHYGAILNESETSLIKKKLSTNSQKLVSCVIKYQYILDGKVYDESLNVGMRRGLNY